MKKIHPYTFEVESADIPTSDCVKCLGAWIDKNLNFKEHVMKKAKIAILNLRKIWVIRRWLTASACETLILSLVMSHLDYCNSMLLGVPNVTLKSFVWVQKIAAKTVLNKRKYDSATEALKELNWLPIRERIEFKVMTLLHKCLFDTSPGYLKNLITPVPTPTRALRSFSDTVNKLIVPLVKRKTFANRSFAVMWPALWNALPRDLRDCENYETFKKKLKTHLITRVYYN